MQRSNKLFDLRYSNGQLPVNSQKLRTLGVLKNNQCLCRILPTTKHLKKSRSHILETRISAADSIPYRSCIAAGTQDLPSRRQNFRGNRRLAKPGLTARVDRTSPSQYQDSIDGNRRYKYRQDGNLAMTQLKIQVNCS